jgi:hypothetical protein
MRDWLITTLLVASCLAMSAAETFMMPVAERNGALYLKAAELEQGAPIAVKNLPGTDAIVVCSEDRCARLTDFVREGEITWLGVTQLAKTLGFTARFSDDRKHVRFESGPKLVHADNSVTGVGDLAPNFRVAGLDGRAVSLADFRGKRVLIQSWASW